MSAIRRSAPIVAAAPPKKPTLLKVKVTESDPTLSVKATSDGFQIKGTASNRGTKRSTLTLEFSGKAVTIPLNTGDTSESVLAKLKKALPKGFVAVELARAKRLPPDLTIGISPVKVAVPTLQPAKIPLSIIGPNAGASVSASLWRNAMPGPGSRPNAIASVTVSGTGFNDAPPDYGVKEVRVYEQGTNKLVMTLKAPPVQDSVVRRGMKEQTYRLEVPLAKLDPRKKYTFAVNTSINGAPAKWVRSEYLAMQTAY